MLVDGEQLCDRTAMIRGVDTWTKQDASEWIATLAHYDPALKVPAPAFAGTALISCDFRGCDFCS